MTDKIETGTMVYVRDKGKKWKKDPREYMAPSKCGGHYCYNKLFENAEPVIWDEVSLENPHEKHHDFLQEGEELWEYCPDSRYNFFCCSSSGANFSAIELLDLSRFRGFALKLGDGEVKVFNNHIIYTDYDGNISEYRNKHFPDLAEIVGAVMLKEGGE